MNRLIDRWSTCVREKMPLGEGQRRGFVTHKAEELSVSTEPSTGRLSITAVATTAAVDMVSEVVLPSGGNPQIFQNWKAVYFNHEMWNLPVATLRTITRRPKGWVVQVLTLPHQFARDVAVAVQEGAINGGSIGFISTSGGVPTQKEVDLYGPHEYIHREWDWLEWSITPSPCNPDAMIDEVEPVSKSVPISDECARGIEKLLARGRIAKASAVTMGLRPRRSVVVKPTVIVDMS